MDSETTGLYNDGLFVYDNLLMHGIGVLLQECCDVESIALNGDVFEYMMYNSLQLTPENYFVVYSKDESIKLFKSICGKIITAKTDNEKKDYWKNKKEEIEYYVIKLSTKLKSYPFFASDLNQVIEDIETRFKELTDLSSSIDANTGNKLRWLGNTNLLATLFYELWKGQEKLRGNTTKPMIEASKNEMINFLINNFIDKNNQPLKESSLNDYLNQSKQEKRAKQGARIELEIPV